MNTWTPERLAHEPPETLVRLQEDEEMHQRIHQATVEYLYRKALGEHVTQQQIANKYQVEKRQIKWRMQMLHGYSERLAQRREERERSNN